MASEDTRTSTQDSLPFGTIREPGAGPTQRRKRRVTKRMRPAQADGDGAPPGRGGEARADGEPTGNAAELAVRAEAERELAASERMQVKDWRKPSNRRGGGKRGGRRRRGRRGERGERGDGPREDHGGPRDDHGAQREERGGPREPRGAQREDHGGPREAVATRPEQRVAQGMFVLDKGGFGILRREESQWKPSKEDIYVSKRLVQTEKLRDGAIVEGRIGRGQKHKYQLLDVQKIDGRDPQETKNLAAFNSLTSIDPDFHYAIGDGTKDVSMRIVDLLCPIGRGQRGLIVAPPRSGKTTLLRQFAHGIETIYTDVHLMVLLVDERPEEATEWKRSVQRGQVFVSTADELAKNHIQLAEAVWKRAMRLVELGEDVVLLLDSITRLARAYNNYAGNSGRTMSGGLDSRAMERPRKIFGSARNTETAGSLTILGTVLVDTGSRMDQLVFEEFKGTGNMELVLNRRLADRRVFPAIDVERTGTRKEEKLVGMRRLKLIHTLRRVLSRMNFVEAMELLITRLEDVELTDEFLQRFQVDPEA